MLRITQSNSSGASVANYFSEGLTQGDYYMSDVNQSTGIWGGKAAEYLGLSGEVEKKDFLALAENQNPKTGERLTPRNNPNRRTGYDFTFSVPKSVSLAYSLTGDERIKQAFEMSIQETMNQIERQEMRTQKGQGKNKHYQKTENLIYAGFTHLTTRPINGIADPHLHHHAFVFNSTWNAEKQRYQSAEISIIKRKAPFYEAAFNSRLSKRLSDMGYQVERRGYQFELAQLKPDTLKKFSRRTAEIEKAGHGLTAKQKDKLGALTRAKKIAGQSWSNLKAIWRSWLNDDETKRMATLTEGKKPLPSLTPQDCINHAVNELFERKSVAKAHQIKALALKYGYGQISPEQIELAMKNQKFIERPSHYMQLVTTQKAVDDENRMLGYLREGKGVHEPLNAKYEPKAEFLNDEQRQAIKHALTDRNQISIVSGGAGVGKTTLVSEIRDAVEKKGTKFFGFAPTSAAKDVLKSEGFKRADTLAQLLVNPKLQEQTHKSLIWVDEAGLISNKDMLKLMTIAKAQKARILLTGDTNQNNSINAGDSLRILEKEGNLKVARVSKIQRQRNSPHFKKIVQLAAKEKIDLALHELDKLGGVKEIHESDKRIDKLLDDYQIARGQGKSSLIISPTHREGLQLTAKLRDRLKQTGEIGSEERQFLQMKNTNWTEETKRSAHPYRYPSETLMVEFHQNAKGNHKKSDRWSIEGELADQKGVLVGTKKGDKAPSRLNLAHADKFTVYQKKDLALAVGDKIRLTKGGKTLEKTGVNNGDIFTVKGFTKKGDIKLHTGKTLSKNYGHMAYGWTTTSHSSQGRTVDRVFIAQSSLSSPAASSEQMYVSLSRAREKAIIYTDSKHDLEKSVLKSGKRMTAREIAKWSELKNKKDVVKKKEIQKTKQRDHGRSITI